MVRIILLKLRNELVAINLLFTVVFFLLKNFPTAGFDWQVL